MTPATGTALLILAFFVLPGFVTLLLRERTYTVPGEQQAFERLLRALFYAALVYGVALTIAVIAGIEKDAIVDIYRGRAAVWQLVGVGLLIALVIPFVIAECGRRWRYSRLRDRVLDRLGISIAHDVRSGWNQALGSIDGAFVRVTTSDGRVIGGVYGQGSLAGYSEHDRDLYLVQRWVLDDDQWFVEPAPGTLGVWVPKESIASLEFYRLAGDQGDHAGGSDSTETGSRPPTQG
jgi:hypothetical protein